MRSAALAVSLGLQLLAHFAVAQPSAECTAKFGPGCQQCETVTASWGEGRSYGYQGGEQRHGRPWGRRMLHGGHRDSDWGDGWGHNSTGLECTACDTGYQLASHHNSTYGSCRCAAGWGKERINSSSTNSGNNWWEHKRGSYKCVNCALENQVPLTDSSNLRLSWDGSSWSLVLASSTNANGWGRQEHWHMNWWWWGAVPPYYAGQCVSCPTGSAPSSDNSRCDASSRSAPTPTPSPTPSGGPDSSPQPAPMDSPAPAPAPTPDPSPAPAPTPSPAPTQSGACITTGATDITTLETDISDMCGADPTTAVSLDVFAWADDPNINSLWFSTDLDIMTVTGFGDAATNLAECSKMSARANETVTVTWLVNDTGITCSPSTGSFQFKVPSFSSSSASGSQNSAANLVAMVNDAVTPTAATATATSTAGVREAVAGSSTGVYKRVGQHTAAPAPAAAHQQVPVSNLRGTPLPAAAAAVPASAATGPTGTVAAAAAANSAAIGSGAAATMPTAATAVKAVGAMAVAVQP